jgi:glycosyltransferase involved in cell wall biosynthesis
MKTNPKITVLMPVYNDERYIRDSINSVLIQTFTDFEFLIIDDGSIDSTADIIKSYCDNRIRYVRNEQNLGLTKSLNIGLDLADGEYIARHDSDDLMEKTRLEKQLDYLQNHPEIVMLGSYYKIVDENNNIIKSIEWPIGKEENLFYILTGDNPVTTVMYRSNILKQIRYNEHFIQAQDIDLYLRTYAAGYLSDNLPDYLNLIRTHEKQISFTSKNRQKQNHIISFHDFHEKVTKSSISLENIEEYLEILVWKNKNITQKNIENILDIFLSLFHEFKIMWSLNNELICRFLKFTIYNYQELFHPGALINLYRIVIKNHLPFILFIKLVSISLAKRIIKNSV